MLADPGVALTNDFWLEALALSKQVTSRRLDKLAELVDEGALKVRVNNTFSLDQAGAVLHYLETERPGGKVVLKMV